MCNFSFSLSKAKEYYSFVIVKLNNYVKEMEKNTLEREYGA